MNPKFFSSFLSIVYCTSQFLMIHISLTYSNTIISPKKKYVIPPSVLLWDIIYVANRYHWIRILNQKLIIRGCCIDCFLRTQCFCEHALIQVYCVRIKQMVRVPMDSSHDMKNVTQSTAIFSEQQV